MPPYELVVKGLALIACGVSGGAALRLHYQSLDKQFRVLFVFLCFQALRTFGLLAIGWWLPDQRKAYFWIWTGTEPFVWLLYILLVLELFSLLLQNDENLQRIGRRVCPVAIALAVFIFWWTVLPNLRSPIQVQVLYSFLLIGRGITFSVIIFMALIFFFLTWWPISLSRNLVAHTVVCTVFLISQGLGHLMQNSLSQGVHQGFNVVLQVITIGCLSSWMLLLTKQGGRHST